MKDRYPPIGDYGFIADCHTAALVSRDGSIDWCCLPRLDSPSCFGRMLDRERGGYCRISPSGVLSVKRRYLPWSLVLETVFTTSGGSVRVTDLFPLRRGGRHEPHRQLLRIVDGISGEVAVRVEIIPRFEYGSVAPWIREYRMGSFIALGGADGLLISGDFQLLRPDRHSLSCDQTVREGERYRLSVTYRSSRALDDGWVEPPTPEELDRRTEEALNLWQEWCATGTWTGADEDPVTRSAIVLRGLSNAASGAIAAAATTSLPEWPGGTRNWDYRFSWIRDSVFTVRSLAEIGYRKEADDFRRFIERSAAGSADELQIMFGIGGERRLTEIELDTLEGYRGSRPVRIGNAAYGQLQLDIHGELLDLAWRWHQGGCSPDDDYWEFLRGLVEQVRKTWDLPDHGIWEVRTEPRHFVFSKVMSWAAVDKGIRLALELGRQAPVEEWCRLRETIRGEIETRGFDASRGLFVQYFGGTDLDGALLRMPMTGFIAWDDPRMVATVDAIRVELGVKGLIRRYPAGSDGFYEPEGTFLACSFWLSECLTRQGRVAEGREVFELAAATGNDLGLYAEQFDPSTGNMLGNFPQALTHLSLISAARALDECERGDNGQGRLNAPFSADGQRKQDTPPLQDLPGRGSSEAR